MDLLGRARNWVKGIGPDSASELQFFRVCCVEGHVIRGRRTEGYQAIRCPECGAGVFVLPRSPLPMPPTPAVRVEEPLGNDSSGEGPIPLADHVPGDVVVEDEIEWLEPVEPGADESAAAPSIDAVDAAISEIPEIPMGDNLPRPPKRAGPERPTPGPAARRARSKPRELPHSGPGPDSFDGPRISVSDRPSIVDRLRRNRPVLVGLAVVGMLLGTIAWTIIRNQRRDYPALVERGREEGIPALDRGDFDQAHRLLSQAASAVEALGGQIGGAEEVRQAAREAAIFVDLIPDRLESILDQRARASDEATWRSQFDREYKGRSILISAEVIRADDPGTGGLAINYLILSPGPVGPRRGWIDFEGFRLFQLSPPEVNSQVQFGARLSSIEPDGDGWRFRLEPDSGVTITHQDALQSLGWTPVETAQIIDRSEFALPGRFDPVLLAILLTPPRQNDLTGETRDQVLQLLGAPRSFARSASQGETVEQWQYQGPSGTRQILNFRLRGARGGPSIVDEQFTIR